MSARVDRDPTAWPELPYAAWKDTYATLHLWTQIVGKIRLAQTPWLNHSWHVVLYVSPRGLSTSSIPYGNRSFELEFDLLNHVLVASTDDGSVGQIGLYPRSVADFYVEVMRSLAELERALMDFLTSTYEAAASLGKWDRAALECAIGVPGKPRAV
jgi:hypothetical protein